ncbi:MAG: hypothetical protein ABIM19_02315 [candidate division WOR-3 bacterium]
MFRIRFPVIREGVSVSHKNLQREIAGLEESKRTGFVRITAGGSRYYLFLDNGFAVGAGIEGEIGRRLESPSSVMEILERVLKMERGTMDAYEVHPELVHHIIGYFAAKTISEDLPGELLNLPEMVKKLQAAGFTGFIWGQGKSEVVVFLSFGEIAGVFVDGAAGTMAKAAQAITDCRVSIQNTAGALEAESVIFSREMKVKMMEETYSEVYQKVHKAHSGAAGFELVVRESMMVGSSECPFLNPFLGLVEIREGKLRVDPGVDPDEIMAPFYRALYAGAKAYLSDDPGVMREVLSAITDRAHDAGVVLR